MHIITRKQCATEGCTSQTRGRDYCTKHLKDRKAAPITSAARRTMFSGCCNAACVEGEKHEYGTQHCEKCKEPCQWKTKL